MNGAVGGHAIDILIPGCPGKGLLAAAAHDGRCRRHDAEQNPFHLRRLGHHEEHG